MTDNKMCINKLRTEFSTNKILCPLFPKCSGCSLQESIDSPPIWKTLQDFFAAKNIDPDLLCKEMIHYRSRVKLAVRGSYSHPKIGLFAEGTHEVVDMPSCPLHYPIMNEACLMIRQKIKLHEIEPYQENGAKGRLRYIQLLASRKTDTIQLSLVFNSIELTPKERAFIEDLYATFPSFHSIWVNFLPGSTNTILGDKWELMLGEKEFWQEILGIEFNFHPSCFSQAHLTVFEEMLKYIDSIVKPGKTILELYAGVGCIGLYLAQKSSNVCFVESSPKAEECFKKTLSKLPLEVSSKCAFFSSSVENLDFSFKGVDLLIVDPPRKGLSKSAKDKIYSLDPKEIIYVSCGPLSFMRDCEEIVQQGWSLVEVKGFLLFPGTDHAEIVAKFSKPSV